MASGITTKTYTPAGAYWVWAEWSSTINVANNTSSVTVISYVGSNSYGYYSSSSNTGSVTVNGTVSSYASNSALAASTPKQELHRTTQTITHNADGTKSISISANHKHSTTFNLTSTATITLDTIPRTSPADLSVSSQAIGGAITVYTNRQSDTFTHTINYYFGNISTNLANNVGVSYVFTLPTAMAGQIPNASSGTGTIKVITYSGSTYVGEVSLPFTATVPDNASYRPTATAITSAIYGTGRDKTISKYVQGVSKAVLGFTATPYGYASIVSSSITIKRLSDNANPMVISGTSGTSGILTLGGVYTVIATTTDSRNRSTTGTPLSITVESYVVPVITSFVATRQASPNTASVDTVRNGTYTYMGGSNPLSVVVARAPRGGAYVNLSTTAGTTSGTFTGTYVSTGSTDTASWDFKLTISDSFGNSAVAMVTVSTSSVALSIKGDIGIGVGKVWEQGTLDIGGSVYINNVELFKLIYPVGSVYIATVATSPATLFGGTWVAMGGQMLIGVNGTYTAGATGGAATHTLSTAEMPSHNHYIGNANTNGPLDPVTPSFPAIADDNGWTSSMRTQYSGGGQAHNNMPPYLAVYMWKRTV